MIALLGPGSWSTFDTAVLLSANLLLGVAVVWWRIRRTSEATFRRLDQLITLLSRVQDEWRYQHRQATHVGTIQGLWRVLEMGLEQGGLPLEMRRKIYEAGHEAFEAFERETQPKVDELAAARARRQ